MYFDSHAHLDDAHFDGDRAAILDDLKNHGVTMVMNVGCDLPSSERSVHLAEQYPFLYAAVGSHPDDADHVDGALLARYRALCASPRVRAIGEIGLDYHYEDVPRAQQRVAIAGVVAMRPDCLILDEATAMLDPRGREQVMQTIHHLNKNMGITVVSITHYMEEAAQADRVLVMSKGHVVMEGTPKEVFSQTEKVRTLHLDVPQAAELRDELVKAGIPMPEGIIDTGECAQALYELLQ